MKNKTLFVFVLVAMLAGCASGNDDTSDSGIDSGTDTSDWFSMPTGEACSELFFQMTFAKVLCTEGIEVSTDFIESTNQLLNRSWNSEEDQGFISARKEICSACYAAKTTTIFKGPFCTPRLPKEFFTGDTETCLLATAKDYVFDDDCRDDINQFIGCMPAWFLE